MRPLACLLAAAFVVAALAGGSAQGAEGPPKPEVAEKLLRSGREAARRGAYAEADQALRGALAACRAGGDERCTWTALSSLTAVAQALGRPDDARRFAQEAAATAHRIRDRLAQGESYHLLALVLAEAGQAEEARTAAERALAVGRELERADLSARALTVQGELEFAAGRTEEACGAFKEALAEAQATDFAPLKMKARMGLGRCLHVMGEHGEAEAAFEKAFSGAVRLGDKLSVAWLMQEMGRLEAARGEPHRAEELLVEALRKYRSLGASAYAERASEDLTKLRAEASLPTEAERAERAAEARRRGVERLQAGNAEAAVRELKEAVSLAPYDPDVHIGLARAYRALGLFNLAEEEDQFASAVSENRSPFDLTSKNPRYLDYFAKAQRQIDRVYVVPAEVSRGELEGSVRVAFTLARWGRLVEASVETSSGSPILDEAALTTLRLAEPFEPFPDGVFQERVTITARFEYDRGLEKKVKKAHPAEGRAPKLSDFR